MLMKIVKRLVYTLLIIYSLDLILKGFDVIVPINLFTIGIVAILGFPGLIMLALSFFFLL